MPAAHEGIEMKSKHRTILQIANVSFEAEFTLEIHPDGSATYEMYEPVHLPKGTFKVYYAMPKGGR